MKRLERRPEAEVDLLGIWVYVATEADASIADGVLDRIEESLHLLANTPEMGRARHELGLDLRSFPTHRYVIFYRITDETVEVVRVLEGSQDIPSIMLGDLPS